MTKTTTKKPSGAQAEPAPKKVEEIEAPRPKKTSVSPAVRKHIAENLKSWMKATPRLDTQAKISEASGIAQTTVSRILTGATPATADILDAIAKAFRRDPGDLLTNNSNRRIQYDPKKFERLPDYEKTRIEAFIKHVLNEYEMPSTDEPQKKTPR